MARQTQRTRRDSRAHECLEMTVAERFESRTVKHPSGCIVWTGGFRGSRGSGYGRMSMGRAAPGVYAHRMAYALAYGEIPAGAHVLHRCDRPACVNPQHLFLGTQADNMKDMASKGRGNAPRGTSHRSNKLTEADVIAIRAGTGTLSALAAQYSVSTQTVAGIRARKYWKHLP